MSCGDGALQTRGTCWFFSIINGFLLSDAGQKILFDHLEKFYKGLDIAEKAYFDDGIDAPCPLRADIIKTKRIYFYKFLDQYLCFRSGPRSVSAKMGKSGNILGGASLAGTIAKAHAGGQGGFPQDELPKILKHLGITDYIMTRHNAHMPIADARKRPHFLVAVASKSSRVDRVPSFRPKTYSKMCCSITIGNSNASNAQQHKWHAITGYVCNGKGYLFDSNQRKPFPCDWWVWKDLEKVVYGEVARAYDFFAGGQITYMGYSFIIFSRNDYIESIKPVCRLKYKKTKTPNGIYTRLSNKTFNEYLKNGTWNHLKPAQIAALKRARARKKTSPGPVLNKNTLNSILESSNNKQNALQKVRNLENAGYKTNFTLLANFYKKLNAKYNTRSPENAFTLARRVMSTAPTKTKRALYYSLYWKTVLPHERKVLAHFRDHGVWQDRNYYKKSSPSVKPPIKRKPVTNSPATARRKKVLSTFKEYWTNQLNSNNRQTVRNYIAAHKSPSPVKATSANRAVWNKYKSALENINALKTAKARAEWLKAKKFNFKKDELVTLRNYVKGKNQANKNRRALKKQKA
jgi:hypothetical protein